MGLGRHDFTPSELAAQLAADRLGEPYLLYRDGRSVLRIVALTAPAVTVGREPGLELVLAWDPEVSRVHARLERVGGRWSVLDDGLSRNGSFLRGERVAGRRMLQPGDRLRFGRTEAVFRDPAALPADTVPAQESGAVAPPALTGAQARVLEVLCRPVLAGEALPATNAEIAAELHVSIETVRSHTKALFVRFDLGHLPQNRKRVELARRAVAAGAVAG